MILYAVNALVAATTLFTASVATPKYEQCTVFCLNGDSYDFQLPYQGPVPHSVLEKLVAEAGYCSEQGGFTDWICVGAGGEKAQDSTIAAFE